MIVELATAAAMFVADRATAAESMIPPMKPRVESCSKYHDARELKQCLDLKMQLLQQPDGDMWDPDWVSAITPTDGVANTSAAAANPKSGRPKGPVAKKPHS